MEPVQMIRSLPHEAFGEEPVRYVKSLADMEAWHNCSAYYDLMGFINGISTAIQGRRIGDNTIHVSETMSKVLGILDKLNAFIDETPPTDQPQRFGNKSYRSWSRKMHSQIFNMLQNALPEEKCQNFIELGFYLSESFGNAVRIDYGTGHELSFIFFMCALFKAELLVEEDNVAAALRLFNSYLMLVRRLQTTYRMEPAGSQGVWSLDDYQFIPFIWGSAQLAYQSPFEPAQFLEPEIINAYKNEYLFISCIDYIVKVKTGHFAEHSNQLWSISAVPSWAKINSGLVKMYMREILSKFPIIQHVYFGKLMSFLTVKPGTTIPSARLGFVPPTHRVSPPMRPIVNLETLPPPESVVPIVKLDNLYTPLDDDVHADHDDETTQKPEEKPDLAEKAREQALIETKSSSSA